MKRFIQILLGASIITSASLWAVPVGTFLVIKGNVQVKPENGKWTKATIGMKFDAKTEIQTSLTGSAVVKFVNGTIMNIASGTSVGIARMVSGSYGTATDVQLSLGRIKTLVAKPGIMDKRNHFRVITPTVVAAVRGSNQEVGYTPETGTEIKMLEHASDIINRNGMLSMVPQGGKSLVTQLQTMPPDVVATQGNMVIFANGSMSGNEADFMLEAGDMMFGGNAGDMTEFFNFFDSFFDDLYNLGFTEIDFDKL